MTTEIECPDCDGWGFIPPAKRMGETLDCEAIGPQKEFSL